MVFLPSSRSNAAPTPCRRCSWPCRRRS